VTVLVFGRDVGILLVAAILYAAVGRREFKPSIFGKANTAGPGRRGGRRAAAPAHRTAILGRGPLSRMLALDATIVLTVVSGLHYAWARVAPGRHGVQRPWAQSKARVQVLNARSYASSERPLFQRCLQSPCRGTPRSQRPRHTPGTRHIRCLRAGKRYVPLGVLQAVAIASYYRLK
jgi:hypothetical protein